MTTITALQFIWCLAASGITEIEAQKLFQFQEAAYSQYLFCNFERDAFDQIQDYFPGNLKIDSKNVLITRPAQIVNGINCNLFNQEINKAILNVWNSL